MAKRTCARASTALDEKKIEGWLAQAWQLLAREKLMDAISPLRRNLSIRRCR